MRSPNQQKRICEKRKPPCLSLSPKAIPVSRPPLCGSRRFPTPVLVSRGLCCALKALDKRDGAVRSSGSGSVSARVLGPTPSFLTSAEQLVVRTEGPTWPSRRGGPLGAPLICRLCCCERAGMTQPWHRSGWFRHSERLGVCTFLAVSSHRRGYPRPAPSGRFTDLPPCHHTQSARGSPRDHPTLSPHVSPHGSMAFFHGGGGGR